MKNSCWNKVLTPDIIYRCFHSDIITGKPCGARKTNPYDLCLKCNKFPSSSHLKILNFADALLNIQGVENKGRGISAVRGIVTYLYVGDIQSANQYYITDGDKIRNFPNIDIMLNQFFASLK